MIKLNKHITALEATQEKIEQKMDELREKMEALEDLAGDEDRDMTKREQNRWDKYEQEIYDLEDEYDAIQNAIDYLQDYAD